MHEASDRRCGEVTAHTRSFGEVGSFYAEKQAVNTQNLNITSENDRTSEKYCT
jgi:hypothetical protein